MRIIIFLLFVAPLAFAAESGQTIKCTDGRVYTNASIIDLTATGIVVSIGGGVTNIAYSKLPQNLRRNTGMTNENCANVLNEVWTGNTVVARISNRSRVRSLN